ncbi:MAG TPA: glycerol-3-phosphate dehydrogenase C-terminal domain-containing protein, partial [Bacillales bacterium]|nr:glycerol-3-phosphate dehydrogenase C-terminal domain-containing protein [Bacillales bacterium]
LIHEEGKDPSEISRKDEIFISPSGLITIAGGKLTGYRKMAERVIDLTGKMLEEDGDGTYLSCQTKNIRLSGGNVGGSHEFPNFVGEKIQEGTTLGLSSEEAEKLVSRYGSNVDHLYEIIQTKGEEASHYGLTKAIFAMIVYALEQEMTATPSDFFIRRTGAVFFHIDWVKEWKTQVIDYMAQRLHWTDEEKANHIEQLENRIKEATVALEEAASVE